MAMGLEQLSWVVHAQLPNGPIRDHREDICSETARVRFLRPLLRKEGKKVVHADGPAADWLDQLPDD